jgi:hypothetical protein
MIYSLNVSSNNITYKPGDTLLLTFSEAFHLIDSIQNVSFDFSPLDTSVNGHNVYIRWSYDNMVWSPWNDWNIGTTPAANQSELIQTITQGKETFYLQFRLIRRGNDTIARTLTNVTIEYTKKSAAETPVVSPFASSSCYPQCSPYQNFFTGVRVDCDPRLLFQPYNVMGPAINLYREAANAASEMFGHCVRYFKTQADTASADPVLKEYSLFNVTDVKDIKVLVPDNQFPDNAIKFLPFDMDFGDGLEVHIVRDHFERAFGCDDLPEQKDYLYFPLIDRMFEVHSAYLYRDFMMSEIYYKVMLYKWQDKLNVMRPIKEINDYVDSITENFDEILQPEIDKEFEDITKPDQYQTVSIGGFDNVRSHINKNLEIKNYDLNNYFTIVGKYFYDLYSGIPFGDLAVRYKTLVNRPKTEHTAFSCWFKTIKSDWVKQTNTYDTIINGFDANSNKGYIVKLLYSNVNNTVVTSGIELTINNQVLTFNTNFPALQKDQWYAIVVNQLNDFSQCSVHIWRMKWSPTNQTQKTTDLQLVFTQYLDFTPVDVAPTSIPFTLRGGTLALTNMRVWKESIEEEKQPVTLNQYVVREAHLTLVTDNAIPPMRLVREYVR